MRMRKKKHGDERLALCADFLACSPLSVSSDDRIFLEIGAGKGGFACEMASRNTDAKYFAMERVSDCVVLAAERAKRIFDESGKCGNLKFIIDTADNLPELFPAGSVDAIFLNFSDPWSKKGYAKRRLTHRRYLSIYLELLKAGGVLAFKTDNVGLFDFSLEEIEAMGLTCEAVTRDLHASEYNEGNVVTEYEAAFTAQGIPINMLRVRKPEGYDPRAFYTAEVRKTDK
ncbi:MAG: tRNA (guanosine(46)-N7)-methyltransferase TrmB [Clostridia bacterium]|nr:tRNA (guanosine(46)-N7)-methyltransferase TrmB [Clostridia bacterium]